MASTIDEETSFGGFTPFSYVVRENNGYSEHLYLAQDTTFADCCKAVAIL